MLQVIRKRLSKKVFYREKGLKGKVKSIVTFSDEAKTIPLLSVKFNENGDITERIIVLSGQKEEMIYDRYGIISEWNIYDMEGKIKQKYMHLYDENPDRLVWNEYDKEGNYTKYISRYDGNNNEIECEQSNENGDCLQKYLYHYDDENRVIKREFFDQDEENPRKQKVIYKYDNQGNCVEEHTYENDILHNITFMEYDKNGNRIALNQEFEDKDIINRTIFSYDEYNHLIRQENYTSFSGELEMECRVHTYEYEYDTQGNWIKCITNLDKVKSLVNTNFRTIEYY